MVHSKDGNSSPKKKHPYRGIVQAEVAAQTRQRIIQASLELFDEQGGDESTLEQIAGRAGVTVQTLLRHFGSKDKLAEVVSQTAFTLAFEERADPAIGDIAGAARSIIDFYEVAGKRILHGLVQEKRRDQLHVIIDIARAHHLTWLERVFAPYLPLDFEARSRLLAELYSITGVYVWDTLRHSRNLGYEQTNLALQEILFALLKLERISCSDDSGEQ